MKKILTILLSALMLMQVLPMTSFAAENELTWIAQPAKVDIAGANYDLDYTLENFIFMDKETLKYGIIDKNGNTIKDAQLDFKGILFFYGDKYMQVYKHKEDNSGRIDAIFNSKGELVVDFGVYDKMEKVKDDIIIAKKGELYGIISPDGKVRTDFIYSEITSLTQGYYQGDKPANVCAKKDGKYGVIDADGKVIIPFEHDSIIRSVWNEDFYIVGADYNSKTKYLLNAKGETVVDGDISQINYDNKVIYIYFKDTAQSTVFIGRDGKRLDDHTSKNYINDYYIFSETDNYYIISKDGKYGLADKNANILIPVLHYGLYTFNPEKEIFYTKEKSEYDTPVYIDAQGNPIEYLNKYSEPRITSAGYIIGKNKDTENYGMVDVYGNVLIPFEYSFITEITDNVFTLKTRTEKEGIATFGTGTKVKDTFEGLVMQINSNSAKVFNETTQMDVAPLIRDGRTMLPARFVAENLGAEVSWNQDTQTVTIKKGFEAIHLQIGSSEAKIEGYRPYTATLDAPAFIENGRTYTPVRFIAEKLGATVFWEPETQSVKILK